MELENEKYFKEASVWKSIFVMAVPSVVIILVMILYNLADMFFIALLEDTSQVAAISLVGPLFSIMAAVATMVGNGGCTMIASAIGAKKLEDAKTYAGVSIWFTIICGLAATVVLLAATDPMLRFLGTTPDAWESAKAYYQVLVAGFVFMLLANTVAMLVRAEGAIKESLVGNLLGTVINIVLDPIFILTFDMGAGGAALATVLGNAVVTLYLFSFIRRKAQIMTLDLKWVRRRPAALGKVLAIGLPNGIGSVLSGFASTFSNQLLALYGTGAIAAMAAAGRGTMITDYLVMAVCMGCQSLISYSYGAGDRKRLREIMRKLLLLVFVMGVSVMALCLIFRQGLIGMFLKEAAAADMGEKMLCILIFTSPLIGIGYLITSYFQALDQPVKAIVISVLRQGALLIPCLYLLNHFFALWGVVWANLLSCVLATLIALIMFLMQSKRISPDKNAMTELPAEKG